MSVQANYEKSVFAKTSRSNARGEGARSAACWHFASALLSRNTAQPPPLR